MKKSPKNIINFFIKNYKPLLLSFLLALVLWLVITTNKKYTTKIEVPLKITRLAPGRVLINPHPEKVVLEISGKGRALIGLNFYQTSINLELPEIKESTTIHLMDYKNHFNIARELGIEIVEILEPKNIKLEVDIYDEVKKPVKIRSYIKPMPGYILLRTQLEKDSVLISGPISILNNIEYIYSDSISKTDVKYPFTSKAALLEPRSGVTNLNPDKINVYFQVEQLVERNIYNIPIQIVGVPSNLIAGASPSTISLRVKGAESAVAAISVDEITVVFNYFRNYRQGQLVYPMQIETPENISWVEASPKTFRLQLKRKENRQ